MTDLLDKLRLTVVPREARPYAWPPAKPKGTDLSVFSYETFGGAWAAVFEGGSKKAIVHTRFPSETERSRFLQTMIAERKLKMTSKQHHSR